MKLAILVPIVLAACGSSETGSPEPAGSAAPAKKTTNGFSASLSAEMKDGSGAAAAPGSATGTAMTGSASAGGAMTGSASAGAVAAGSGAVVAGSGAVATTGAKPDTTKPDTTKPDTTKPGAGSAAAATTGAKPDTTKPGAGSGAATPSGSKVVGNSVPAPITTNGPGPARPAANRAHVNPPAELAAIKIDLEPNWDRDYGEAGTFSFVLRIPNSDDTRLFSFRYGYDLAGAPADREAYKKFLGDQKVLNVTLDRQRGAAWYLEGTDAAGSPAFRVLVLYGGKRLVCGGSLYKDQAATALGPDLRDKVVAAAKKICETLAL